MKYLKTYENINKSYYEFDAIKFYNDFKEIFKNEKQKHPDFSGHFFDFLITVAPDYKKYPLNTTIENFIKNILQDKQVEFYDLAGDINSGLVKQVQFYYSIFYEKFSYLIDIYGSLAKYGYPEEEESFVNVDQSIPVKIYDNPTEIEKYIEQYKNLEKYNI